MQKVNTIETILLYNIKGQPYTPQLKTILLKMGIRIKVVAPEDYTKKIGELLGLETNSSSQPPAVAPSESIPDEMIVMYNFIDARLNQLLSELRRAGIKIPLKAVLTPHNSNWTSYELHAELSEERKAFQDIEQNNKKE